MPLPTASLDLQADPGRVWHAYTAAAGRRAARGARRWAAPPSGIGALGQAERWCEDHEQLRADAVAVAIEHLRQPMDALETIREYAAEKLLAAGE